MQIIGYVYIKEALVTTSLDRPLQHIFCKSCKYIISLFVDHVVMVTSQIFDHLDSSSKLHKDSAIVSTRQFLTPPGTGVVHADHPVFYVDTTLTDVELVQNNHNAVYASQLHFAVLPTQHSSR